jgi:hypothetical protein
MLLINQKDAVAEGVFKFIVTNIPEFETHAEVTPLIQEATRKAGWHPGYIRRLSAAHLRLADPVRYSDQTGVRMIRPLHLDIQNHRPDLAAVGCVARLVSWGLQGQALQQAPDRSSLKVTGLQGYEQTIWPQSHGAFDLLGVEYPGAQRVFLNSALDVQPRLPLICSPGDYHLCYEVLSQAFPPLEAKVHLHLTGDFTTTNANLI